MRRSVPTALLERIARHRTPGLLLRRLLDAGEGETMHVEIVYQLPLWIITNAPARGRLRECDLVVCRLGGILLAGRCVDRQAACWPSGKRKGRSKFPECQGCTLGEGYRARLTGYLPPKDSQPAEVASYSQRMAKMQGRRERLHDGEDEQIDPLGEVSAMTPDDRRLP